MTEPPPNSTASGPSGLPVKVELGTVLSQKLWLSPELMMGVLPCASICIMKLRSVLNPSQSSDSKVYPPSAPAHTVGSAVPHR